MGIFNQNNGQQNQQQPSAGEKTKGYCYRCKKDCTFGGEFKREGDVIVSAEKLEVSHFEPVEEKGERH